MPVDLDGSGLDRGTVDRARDAIKDNVSPSKVGDRFWELSGVLKCAECGRNMIAYRRAKQNGHNHYYRCRPSSTVDVCENRKSHNAERVEAEVHRALRTMVEDREMLTRKIAESFEWKRGELSRAVSDTAPLIEKLAYLDRRKDGFWDLAADGDLPKEIMRRKVEEIDAEQEVLRTALDDARHRDERLEELDLQEERLLKLVDDHVDHGPPGLLRPWRYEGPDGTHTITSVRMSLTEELYAPQNLRRIYLELGLSAEIDAEGRTTIGGTLTAPPSDTNGGQKGALQTERTRS